MSKKKKKSRSYLLYGNSSTLLVRYLVYVRLLKAECYRYGKS